MDKDTATLMLKALDAINQILVEIAPGHETDLDDLRDTLNKIDLALTNTVTGESEDQT